MPPLLTAPTPFADSRDVDAIGPLLPIAAVERETGLGKDTLRAWERRYGFPRPARDAAGVRGYPRVLVERLRLVARALRAGHRPGRLFALPGDELDALLAAISVEPALAARVPVAAKPGALALADGLSALRVGGAQALRHWLTRALARLGLGAFVVDGLGPLAAAIGDAWRAGTVAVYEEHLFSEAVQSVLRAALLPFQTGFEPAAPHVLLTTLPGEAHGLGLLMAEALLTLEACRCLPLGVQTPVADIAAAARAHRVDVVALGFSAHHPASADVAVLQELRERLPAGVAIWAGGAVAPRARRLPGIRVVGGLVDLPDAVAAWRREPARKGARP